MSKFLRDIDLEKEIDAYVKGNLPDKEADELWSKLLVRPKYIELLETELGVKSILLHEASSTERQAEEGGIFYQLKKYSKWAAAAAVIIMMVVMANLLKLNTTQSIQSLSIDKINLTRNLLTVPVTRSQTNELTTGGSLLNLGFQAAILGEVDRALQHYQATIAADDSELAVARAHFNIGIIKYNAGDFESAISAFKKAASDDEQSPYLAEKALWYLGNAYLNRGELMIARNTIQTVYEKDGIYSEEAFKLLQKLNQKLKAKGAEVRP